MRTMIDLGTERGPIGGMHIINTSTTVDCSNRQVGFRRSFRSLLYCCAAGFQPPHNLPTTATYSDSSNSSSDTDSPPSSTTIKGTFFGQRNGRVNFCLQDHAIDRRRRRTNATSSSFTHPLLILEFGFPTAYLAREMQHGLLRIALVEEGGAPPRRRRETEAGNLFGVPVWSVYCNGRKVGFATKRQVTASDVATLKLMQSVSVGAGMLPAAADGGDVIMYLRASFQRVVGSQDSEAFYMINPDRERRKEESLSNNYSSGQELSIFLLRSSS